MTVAARIVTITDLEFVITREETFGRFWLPFEQTYPANETRRFRDATDVVERCLRWTWYQWLRNTDKTAIQSTAVRVLAKSLRLQKEERDSYWRANHDVACIHLAIIAGAEAQLPDLAEQIVSSDMQVSTDWSLHAWSGLWKFWLLGRKDRARLEAENLYSSQKPLNLRLPRKPVVKAWLEQDWKLLGRAIAKSYQQSWGSLEKGSEVRLSSLQKIEFEMKSRSNRTMGHWQENAFALDAARRGVSVPRDPLWLPSNIA